MSEGKILFIDAYDSFSNNIISLLKQKLPVSVESIHIDDPRFVFNDDAFFDYLQHFDAVVAGPGPGHPANDHDIGLISKLWTLDNEHLLPVLGICLGFQSLCLAYGATVDRLKQPRHGLVTPITHCEKDVFKGTDKVLVTQYHSLHVKLDATASTHDNSSGHWASTLTCPHLSPLAWDLSDPENGPILMAVRHRHRPLRGVQYHPESICTNDEGHKLVVNWWEDACRWNAAHRHAKDKKLARKSPDSCRTHEVPSPPSGRSNPAVSWSSYQSGTALDATMIMAALRSYTPGHAPILLESGTRNGRPVNSETGRFSIVGLQDEHSVHIRYCVSSCTLDISQGGVSLLSESLAVEDVFSTLEQFVADRKAIDGPGVSPFWGGLVGFVSYEAGLESIDVAPSSTSTARPDVWFVLVERSIVLDHKDNTVYIQSVREHDGDWLGRVRSDLVQLGRDALAPATESSGTEHSATLSSGPSMVDYCQKVEQCQAHLRAGSSYELCLTDQTHIRSPEEPWTIYRRLRLQNPAPFGAYISLASAAPGACDVTVLSSSPERFLSWSRSGECQFRPIKGTVKKGAGVTRQDAEDILGSAKEKAENLMIVDLIRHDLSGVRGYVSKRLTP